MRYRCKHHEFPEWTEDETMEGDWELADWIILGTLLAVLTFFIWGVW